MTSSFRVGAGVLTAAAVCAVACSPGDDGAVRDVAADSDDRSETPDGDVAADSDGLPDEAADGDDGGPLDGTDGSDEGVPPECDPRFRLRPAEPTTDAPLDVDFTDMPGYVFVGLEAAGAGSPVVTLTGVAGSGPFTWSFRVSGLSAGPLTLTFTADNGATRVASCDVDVREGTGPVGPPVNRFGIGLVGPGNPAQWDLAANLVGRGGHIKLIFPGIDVGMTGPPAEWSTAIAETYSRNMVPVVRINFPWGDGRVRYRSDDPRHSSYTALAASVRAVVERLPLRAGWPIYIEVLNEPNLCYEWTCDAGDAPPHPGTPAGRMHYSIIAREYAALLRDVGAALHAIGDPRVRVVNAGLAPGGAVDCECGGTGFTAGVTALDFLVEMRGAVPDVFGRLDAFASHSYPAQGEGWGFFERYEVCGPGLRFFERELETIGASLPVLVTETGWTTDAGARGSRTDIADWTRRAYEDVWLVHPAVRAVMPFQLQDAAWDAFGWVAPDGTRYPVYDAVRALRCSLGTTDPC